MLNPGRAFGWIYTQLRAMSKAEWIVIAVIIAVLIALVPPTPHWREISYQSCHLCGNPQATMLHFGWWKLDRSVAELLGTKYAAGKDHVNDWWNYGHSYIS